MSGCRIQFAPDRCASIGMCEAIAPDIFTLDDDGRLQLLQQVVDDTRRAEVEEAVRTCPTQSLTIVE